jgi:hypothetical protein
MAIFLLAANFCRNSEIWEEVSTRFYLAAKIQEKTFKN